MESVQTLRIFKAMALLLFIAPACAGVISQQGESVRGLFVKTRPDNQTSQKSVPSSGLLALGYTMYLRDSSGQPARVDSVHRFAEGEAMRLIIEPNSDGYFYIFDREGNGPVEMIFPDLRLRNGDARITAHTPLQIPSGSTDKDWFTFTGQPQGESLILVFSREPVTGWPRGRELLQYPNSFRLSWDQLIAKAPMNTKPSFEKITTDLGQPLSSGERASLSRGLKLMKDDPLPSVIEAVNEGSNVLSVYIELMRR